MRIVTRVSAVVAALFSLATAAQAGLVLAAYGLGALVSQLLGGWATDHLGRRTTLVSSLLLSAGTVAAQTGPSDKATAEAFSQDEANWMLRDALSGQMASRGLLCRLDDRDQPVIQLSPPLIADMDTVSTMLGIVKDALLHVDGQVRNGEAPWS